MLLLLNRVISDQYISSQPSLLFVATAMLLQINLEKSRRTLARDPLFGPKRGQVEADDKESSINSTLASSKLDLRTQIGKKLFAAFFFSSSFVIE